MTSNLFTTKYLTCAKEQARNQLRKRQYGLVGCLGKEDQEEAIFDKSWYDVAGEFLKMHELHAAEEFVEFVGGIEIGF
jgi:hypothetical protein